MVQPLGAVPIDQVIYPTQKCACKVNCKCNILYVKLSDVINKPSTSSKSQNSLLDDVKDQVSNLSYRQLKELLDDYKLSIQGSSGILKQRFITFISNKNQVQLTNISNYIKQVEARVK